MIQPRNLARVRHIYKYEKWKNLSPKTFSSGRYWRTPSPQYQVGLREFLSQEIWKQKFEKWGGGKIIFRRGGNLEGLIQKGSRNVLLNCLFATQLLTHNLLKIATCPDNTQYDAQVYKITCTHQLDMYGKSQSCHPDNGSWQF